MKNFVSAVNGATTFNDYLSIFTTDYKESSYIVNLALAINRPDQV